MTPAGLTFNSGRAELCLIGCAGCVWAGTCPGGLLHLQSDTHLEQWLQAGSGCAVLWAGYHVAGPQAVLLGRLLCGLSQPGCHGVHCLGAWLPSPHQ